MDKKLIPAGHWTDAEIAAVIVPLLEAAEAVALTSPDERLSSAATCSIRRTRSYDDLLPRRASGEHVAYGDLMEARERLQDGARALADMQEIVAIGAIPAEWDLYSHRDGLALYRDGEDEPTMVLPRGTGRDAVLLVAQAYKRAYELGKRHGIAELQAGLHKLLGVAVA